MAETSFASKNLVEVCLGSVMAVTVGVGLLADGLLKLL